MTPRANPISPPAQTALIIGGVVAGIGLLGYIFVVRAKNALGATIGAPVTPVKSAASPGKYPYTFTYRGLVVTVDLGVPGGTNGIPPGYFSTNVDFPANAPGGALNYGDGEPVEDNVIAKTKARIDQKLDTGT